jgi:hypothetical protein
MDLGIALDGSANRVALRFEHFPQAAHDRLLATLTSLEQRLEAMVIAAEPNLSGALRGLTGGRVYDHDSRIAAVVGVRTQTKAEALKAAALEYGSHKALMVRAHTAKLAHLWSRAINQIVVDVPEYGRTSNIDPLNFLRGPLAAIRGDALDEMRAALDAAVKDAAV